MFWKRSSRLREIVSDAYSHLRVSGTPGKRFQWPIWTMTSSTDARVLRRLFSTRSLSSSPRDSSRGISTNFQTPTGRPRVVVLLETCDSTHTGTQCAFPSLCIYGTCPVRFGLWTVPTTRTVRVVREHHPSSKARHRLTHSQKNTK